MSFSARLVGSWAGRASTRLASMLCTPPVTRMVWSSAVPPHWRTPAPLVHPPTRPPAARLRSSGAVLLSLSHRRAKSSRRPRDPPCPSDPQRRVDPQRRIDPEVMGVSMQSFLALESRLSDIPEEPRSSTQPPSSTQPQVDVQGQQPAPQNITQVGMDSFLALEMKLAGTEVDNAQEPVHGWRRGAKDSVEICEQTPPTPPRPSDCCGEGCVNCVWVLYADHLRAWRNHRATCEKRHKAPADAAAVVRPGNALRRKRKRVRSGQQKE